MDEKIMSAAAAVADSGGSSRLPLAVTVEFAGMLDELRAYVADLNHNLNPFPDEENDPLSWDDRQDRVQVNFSVAAAAHRVCAKLASRGARLQLTASAAQISLPEFPANYEYSYHLTQKIRYYILLSVQADKLSMYAGRVEGAEHRRDELLQEAEDVLQELSSMLCLIDNDFLRL